MNEPHGDHAPQLDGRVVARGIAVSDLHLGYRALPAQEGGRNVREVDVERAWAAVVDAILAIHSGETVDVVTIGGDMFHNTRPSFHAVKVYRDGVRRLTEAGIPVVAVQGNHDGPKTTDSLNPAVVPDDLPLYTFVGSPEVVHVRAKEWAPDGEVRGIKMDRQRTRALIAIACFPYCVLDESASWSVEPMRSADVNVLLIHGAVRANESDPLPYFYAGQQSLDVGTEAARWDVIACGDWHTYRTLHPERAAFYSGAIERTTSNVWDEGGGKGFVKWEVVDHAPFVVGGAPAGDYVVREVMHRFVELPTRPVHDYDMGDFDRPPRSSVEDVNFALGQMAGSLKIGGALCPEHNTLSPIVRLKVYGLPTRDRHAIDQGLVALIRSACLHFDLDLRESWIDDGDFARGRRGAAAERRTLAAAATEFFAEDRPSVREKCLTYLGVQYIPAATRTGPTDAEASIDPVAVGTSAPAVAP